MLTDSLAHPPLDYATFTPASATFPALGKSFTDPVFGEKVTRLTEEYPRASESDIYSKNGFWNATGTLMRHNTPAGAVIIYTSTGAVTAANVPGGYDGSFDPVDPDVWYYFSGKSIKRYSVATGVSTNVKTFASFLGALGGSVDWVDRSGRYMVLSLGGQGRVYDKHTDSLYAGACPGNAGDGWLGISPDGNYVVTAFGPRLPSGQPIKSYRVNHAAKSLSTVGIMFWSLCGAHGDLLSTEDGRSFLITTECHSDPGIWAVDVSKPQTSTASGLIKQRSDNRKLLALAWPDNDCHISCGGEWAYVSTESTDDPHGGPVSPWRAYKQEVIRINVVTGEVQRLAHHRSRGLGGGTNYRWQPRVCASWDGSRVAWASNMGANAPDYGDLWTCTPGAVVTPPVPPEPPEPPPARDIVEVLVNGVSVYRTP